MKYKGIWYNMDRAVMEDPNIIDAENEQEAHRKFMVLYPEDKRPAEFISITHA